MKGGKCQERVIRCMTRYWFVRLLGKGKKEAEQQVRAQAAGDVLRMVDSRTQNLAQQILQTH